MESTKKKAAASPNLVLIRHGESEWNRQNRFTGWVDIGLSLKGKEEARRAGRLLRRRKLNFDRAYASGLKRSQQTLKLALKEAGLKLPTVNAWQLNERHYGALQGMNKLEMIKHYGADQVLAWRRSYGVRPPALNGDCRFKQVSPEACGLKSSQFPKTESLRDTYRRVVPYWKKEIVPALKRGERVLIVAHGNSLRALVKLLEQVSDKDIALLEIPTGKPLGYHLSKAGRVTAKAYLS